MYGLFKSVIYAETESEFQNCQTKLEKDEIAAKYPEYLRHLAKAYGNRVETWATYIRNEKGLPTRGSNTNNYCEASMRTTKERQFGRVRTFNLPELLRVVCDDSTYYRNKLISIGNNRDTVLKQGNSKYMGKVSTIQEDQVVDLGEGRFLVDSEGQNNEDWYLLDLLSGYCSCPVGKTCKPCKHKAVAAKFSGKAYFSVTPSNDPCMRALYHYVATGKTLPSYCYRSTGSPDSNPRVDEFIAVMVKEKKTMVKSESLLHVDEKVIEFEDKSVTAEDNNESIEGQEFDADLVAGKFIETMRVYTEMILKHHSEKKQDPATNRAITAMTRTIK